jgi:tricarballylate dehydrogenase
VAVDRTAQVIHEGDSRFVNVWAAGEIMSGNVLSSGYVAGFGMTIGTVWGRIAGKEAARHAHG